MDCSQERKAIVLTEENEQGAFFGVKPEKTPILSKTAGAWPDPLWKRLRLISCTDG
jgi:hypothetical protein